MSGFSAWCHDSGDLNISPNYDSFGNRSEYLSRKEAIFCIGLGLSFWWPYATGFLGRHSPRSRPMWMQFSEALLLQGTHYSLVDSVWLHRCMGGCKPNENDFVFLQYLYKKLSWYWHGGIYAISCWPSLHQSRRLLISDEDYCWNGDREIERDNPTGWLFRRPTRQICWQIQCG